MGDLIGGLRPGGSNSPKHTAFSTGFKIQEEKLRPGGKRLVHERWGEVVMETEKIT